MNEGKSRAIHRVPDSGGFVKLFGRAYRAHNFPETEARARRGAILRATSVNRSEIASSASAPCGFVMVYASLYHIYTRLNGFVYLRYITVNSYVTSCLNIGALLSCSVYTLLRINNSQCHVRQHVGWYEKL